MAGVRLEAKVHIVTGAVSSAQNIVKCANRSGLNVADIVLEPLASRRGGARARTRRSWASCLVDIGGGTTDIAIFSDGAIVHTAVLALGGNHLTNDIAVGLRTPRARGRADQAEATAARWPRMVDKDETIEVPSRRRPRSRACSAGRSSARSSSRGSRRSSSSCSARSQKSGYEDLLASGVVITGGATLLRGHARARRGGPRAAGAPRACRAASAAWSTW